MRRAQEKRGSHKRISKPYQRLVRSGRAVETLPIRANWETSLNLKIKDEEQQLTCLVTENIALNARCNLIFQNHDHKHLRLLFNSIIQTIKVSVGLWLSWVRWQRNKAGPGWLWSHNGTDTVRTHPRTWVHKAQLHFAKTHSLACRSILICVSWALIGWIRWCDWICNMHEAYLPCSEGSQPTQMGFSKAMLSTLGSFENASPQSLLTEHKAGASLFSKVLS